MLVFQEGVEPTTHRVWTCCLCQLDYWNVNGAVTWLRSRRLRDTNSVLCRLSYDSMKVEPLPGIEPGSTLYESAAFPKCFRGNWSWWQGLILRAVAYRATALH